MANMRVQLILDLVNRMSPGAKAAARDIKGLKAATGALKGERGPERVRREIDKLSPASRQAARYLREVKTGARDLARERGPDRLASGLERTQRAATRAAREMRNARREQVALARSGAGELSNRAGDKTDGGLLAAGRNKLAPLVGAYLGVQGIRAGVRGTVGQSISFEKAMTDVRKKVDGADDPAAFEELRRLITTNAIRYGRSRESVAALVAEAGASGITREDLPEFVRITLAAATAWDATADKASEALAKIRAGTQWSNGELEQFVDKVNALSDAGSAKEMDVVDMFQRAGAAAKAAGVDFDSSLAFLTAMNNIAIAPETAARGFAAFAARLRTATAQGKNVSKGLGMLGLTPKGVEAGMRNDARGTMIDVLERLEKSADKAKAAIQIFGREWWDEVARSGQALPEIRKNLAIVNDPAKWQGSAQKNLNVELSTTQNHLERLKALASEVGDRLGAWALPGINDTIERLIKGLEDLDRRAAERKEIADLGRKLADGEELTPAERERLKNPDAAAAAATAQIARSREMAAGVKRKNMTGEGLQALEVREVNQQITELQAVVEKLDREIATVRNRSRNETAAEALTGPLRLRRDQAQADLDEARRIAGRQKRLDSRRPADQDERAQADRGERLALQVRIEQFEAKLSRLATLEATLSNPADRAAVRGEIRLAENSRVRALAPHATAAGRFGFGIGGAPSDARGGSVGSGQTSFLPRRKGADAVRGALDFDSIDLGPAGNTMMERLAAGLREGASLAQREATSVHGLITGAMAGGDLSATGQAMMNSLAAGIRAGGATAIAEAGSVAARVRAAAAGASPKGLSGALHDGVD